MKTKTYDTNYGVAVNWLHNSFILCNEISEIDPSIIDNAQFDFCYYTDDEGNQYSCESDYEGEGELEEHYHEIFQFYLTNCTEDEIEYLTRTFPKLLFTYSDLLNLYVLCVDHFGTNWYYVNTITTLENAKREEGEKK